MTGKTVDLLDIITPTQKACRISELFIEWDALRQVKVDEWREVQEYVFAVDTTKTANSKLPWSNKTTLPKLCQIRDNLHANYMAAMFPQRKWLTWEGDTEDDNSLDKREVIESYMNWVVDRNHYYNTISQLVSDYIDYGNCFVMPEWLDMRSKQATMDQVGYVGPAPRRISPLDIVFNPIAPSFEQTPKIIRSLVSLGEVKDMILSQAQDEESLRTANELWKYLRDIRENSSALAPHSSISVKDRIYNIAGFSSYQNYLQSGTVEILTFYGDIYDYEKDELQKNMVIKVVDRHKIIYEAPNSSIFGFPPIFHCGWRIRPDNLWAAGPLDNLVGMQYRIDHLENMKADVFDLIAYPPLKVRGTVEDFDWAPMERVYMGDDGDVDLLSPDVQALQADTQIAILEQKMEEFAGSPKEAMGFRTPGEKTKYEVQSLENAAGRIFQNKITHFERHVTENTLNAMLELSRRNMSTETIRIFDDETKATTFVSLSAHDIAGLGRIRPVAARHFAEKANMIQNLTNFYQFASAADPEIKLHFSAVKQAKIWEDLLEIRSWKIVEPFIRLAEQADSQRLMNSYQEDVNEELMTPTGIKPGDFDEVEGEPQGLPTA